MKIALDAFGGDNGAEVNIRGALDFVKDSEAHVILTGPKEAINKLLPGGHPKISVVDAPDVIDMAEKASSQLRNRKDSSMYRAIQLVEKGEAQAAVSAGSSAACMALSVLILKRLKFVERPALITPFPTLTEPTFCLDMGANVDCKPIHLLHFALMGHAYAQAVSGRPNPKIGLLSNGEEESKGNELVRQTHELLKGVQGIRYVGPVEGRDIFTGEIDVVVCDGFVGNLVLKTAEGCAEAIVGLMKNSFSSSLGGKLGYLLAKKSLTPLKKKVDYAQYGGAPLLGVNGLSYIAHGRSNSLAIANALRTAQVGIQSGLLNKLGQALDLVASASEGVSS